MPKRIIFLLLTLMFFVLFSVSTSLAKNDKPKHEKNTPKKSERALEQQEINAQKHEQAELEKGPKGPKGGPSGRNGRSFMGKLYFFEENPDPEDLIVPDEEEEGTEDPAAEDPEGTEPEDEFIDEENEVQEIAWGKMNYNLVGPYLKFVFNGHGLEVDMDYTLIYAPNYPEWDGKGLVCLGSGISDEFGDVHINERVYDLCDLPSPEDENDGAQLILALTEDVDCDNAAISDTFEENTSLYLFGYNLIKFHNTTCTEEEPEL